jgi:electron transfer flavoprotein alpha subunit
MMGAGAGEGEHGLRTVALIKQVPVGGGTGALGADGRILREGLVAEMNPWCRRAVTQAVLLGQGTEGRSTAITMGPPAAADILREAMACGVDDALHLCDPALAGSDCLVTARTLAAAIAGMGEVDLILVGRSSVDGNTAAVGSMVAEFLGLPFAGPALSITLDRTGDTATLRMTLQSEGGTEPADVRLPAVVAVAERSCPPAKAPAASWPGGAGIRTLTWSQVTNGDPPTSPTEVVRVRGTSSGRRPAVLTGDLDDRVRRAVDLWEVRERADGRSAREQFAVPAPASGGRKGSIMVLAGCPDRSRALLGEAADLAGRAGARVLAIVPPEPDVERLTAWGADELIIIGRQAPRSLAAALASWIEDHTMPWAILGSARSWDREVLGRLAVRLDAGLMSDLIDVYTRVDESGAARLVGAKPSGNATIAEIVSHGPTQIATLRTGCLDLRTPRTASLRAPAHRLEVPHDAAVRLRPRRPEHDYDALERVEIVIGVGRGVDPRHHDELLPLCARLGAELAATRKVTDAGWLPHSRQVGITARNIAPRLYIALGISGSTNHMVGVARAGTVLAVNNDPEAAIFAHCDIGIVADWREAAPRIAAELERRGHTRAALRRPATTDALT